MNVLVYGTLKKGKHNHDYMNGCEYLGEYYTDKNYALIVAELPFLVKRENGGGCSGELYRVDKKTLRLLDLLEGHPTFYRREEIIVYDFEAGTPVKAYVYLHPDVFDDKEWKYEQVRSF